MRIAIESTGTVVSGGERLWVGFTESGIPVTLLVAAVSPVIAGDDPRHQEFRRDLTDMGRITPEHMTAINDEMAKAKAGSK